MTELGVCNSPAARPVLATFKPRARVGCDWFALCRSLLVTDEVDDARLLAARQISESAQRAAAVGAACNLEAAQGCVSGVLHSFHGETAASHP